MNRNDWMITVCCEPYNKYTHINVYTVRYVYGIFTWRKQAFQMPNAYFMKNKTDNNIQICSNINGYIFIEGGVGWVLPNQKHIDACFDYFMLLLLLLSLFIDSLRAAPKKANIIYWFDLMLKENIANSTKMRWNPLQRAKQLYSQGKLWKFD